MLVMFVTTSGRPQAAHSVTTGILATEWPPSAQEARPAGRSRREE